MCNYFNIGRCLFIIINVIYLSNSTIYASGSLTEEIIIQNLSDTTTTFIMETVSYDHILVENAYWDTTFSKVAASLLTGGSVVIPHNGQEGWEWKGLIFISI